MSKSGSAALRLVVALLVIGGAYVGAAWFLGQHVPANATVAGVPIGGMTPARAQTTLARALADKERAPVVLQSGDRTVQVTPAQAGLALDLERTVDGLSGFSLAPGHLWEHLTGGSDAPLRTSVDRARLKSAVETAAKPFEVKGVDGGITFPGGKVVVVQPVAGASLAVDRTVDVVARRWPASSPVQVALDVTPPRVSAEEVNRVNTEFATPAMSGPVKVVVGAKSFQVKPAAYAPALSVKADPSGKLAPAVDNAKLVAAVRQAASQAGLATKARDARITFSGTKAVVVPSVNGTTLEEQSVISSFVPALTAPARTATVTSTVVKPKLTTAQAEKIKPREVISTFTTYFPYNPPRTENITIAARTINGTFVAPGQTFSLNGALGPRTSAKGYNEAPVIINGRLTKDYGGGISQLSTTLFNAVFFSGARIEEHHPHSFYISRYPEGREATLSWPDVDNRFTNDTGYGILIQAYVSGNSVTVTFHGTKVWDIAASKGPRRNVVQPRTIVDDRASCVPQTPTPGFDVTVTRIFKKAGKQVKTSTFNTHYIPEDKVTCTNPSAG